MQSGCLCRCTRRQRTGLRHGKCCGVCGGRSVALSDRVRFLGDIRKAFIYAAHTWRRCVLDCNFSMMRMVTVYSRMRGPAMRFVVRQVDVKSGVLPRATAGSVKDEMAGRYIYYKSVTPIQIPESASSAFQAQAPKRGTTRRHVVIRHTQCRSTDISESCSNSTVDSEVSEELNCRQRGERRARTRASRRRDGNGGR